MHVCLDVQAAIAQRAGVGRYVQSLVDHLADVAARDTVRLFYFDFGGRQRPRFDPRLPVSRNVWAPRRVLQRAWSRFRAPAFDRFSGAADVFHFPNFILPPVTRGKCLVTVHDLAFLAVPETGEAKNQRYLSSEIRHTVERADGILTISEFTAQELRNRLNVPRGKIVVAPLGVSSQLGAPAANLIPPVLARLGIERPYLLHVGTVEPRKNIPLLVEAFENLSHFDGELVLVGARGWKYEPILRRIEESPLRARIRRLDFVSEDDLPALYAGAEVFAFPSRYEGFGLPPLEAMACGVPVVASAEASLPEVVGDAGVYPESLTAEAWAVSLQGLLDDSNRADDLRARGFERARTFRWEDTARCTLDAYQSVYDG